MPPRRRRSGRSRSRRTAIADREVTVTGPLQGRQPVSAICRIALGQGQMGLRAAVGRRRALGQRPAAARQGLRSRSLATGRHRPLARGHRHRPAATAADVWIEGESRAAGDGRRTKPVDGRPPPGGPRNRRRRSSSARRSPTTADVDRAPGAHPVLARHGRPRSFRGPRPRQLRRAGRPRAAGDSGRSPPPTTTATAPLEIKFAQPLERFQTVKVELLEASPRWTASAQPWTLTFHGG